MLILYLSLTLCMVNAKLTIQIIDGKEEFNVYELYLAKVRQVLIEIHGEEWFKDYFSKHLALSRKGGRTYFGQNGELIICAQETNDLETLLVMKEDLDYLSTKEDTIYLLKGYDIPRSIQDIIRVCKNVHYTRHLFINMPYNEDVRLLLMPLPLSTDNLSTEYYSACREKGCIRLFMLNEDRKSEVTQKDIDLFYEYTMKWDRELLDREKEIKSTPIESGFHYQVDKEKQVLYVEHPEDLNEKLYLELIKNGIKFSSPE